jgi:hypothetical protein
VFSFVILLCICVACSRICIGAWCLCIGFSLVVVCALCAVFGPLWAVTCTLYELGESIIFFFRMSL